MANSEIEEIRAKLCQTLGVESISDDEELTSLGMDSLDVVTLCLQTEDDYGIHFETEELSSFKTVKDLFDAISAKLAKRDAKKK